MRRKKALFQSREKRMQFKLTVRVRCVNEVLMINCDSGLCDSKKA